MEEIIVAFVDGSFAGLFSSKLVADNVMRARQIFKPGKCTSPRVCYQNHRVDECALDVLSTLTKARNVMSDTIMMLQEVIPLRERVSDKDLPVCDGCDATAIQPYPGYLKCPNCGDSLDNEPSGAKEESDTR